MADTKTCPNCGETKSVTEFSKNNNRADGRQSWCKKCSNERNKELYKSRKKRKLKNVEKIRGK